MSRYNVNDRVVVNKNNDRNNGQHGSIINISNLSSVPVTIYDVIFDNGNKGYYFFSELTHEK